MLQAKKDLLSFQKVRLTMRFLEQENGFFVELGRGMENSLEHFAGALPR
jgi:hypothetical protein